MSAAWAMLATRPSLDVSSINLILFLAFFGYFFVSLLELRAYAHCRHVTTRLKGIYLPFLSLLFANRKSAIKKT